MKKIPTLIACLALTLGVGAIAGIATANSIDSWYSTIQKPSFNPPNYVFGPVWTLLYILMGISLYMIIIAPPHPLKRKAIILFILQLFFNFCWSFIFFSFHELLWASVEIIVLWVLILLTIIQFSKINKIAPWLLVPYLAWVSFATRLTFSVYFLNR
jgi:tryptophan-rich sensory protein